MFAVDLFGPAALGSDAYLSTFGSTLQPDDALISLRDRAVPAFLDAAEQHVLSLRPTVVGFSCTFNQVLASLALARRLKTADPSLTVLFGGACVHGEMGAGYRDAFPDIIDHVFTGEADDSFPDWLAAYEAGEPDAPIPGVLGRRSRIPPRLTFDLDRLPVPDYTDFYRQHRLAWENDAEASPIVRHLPYESSRGCWWGEKSHCTFCGLNNEGLAFRRKTPERTVAELDSLAAAYGTTSFMASDNILDFRAYKDLLLRLAASPNDFDLFYEIKANVRRDDIAALRGAGVWRVQPGVESFSDHVLRLMRKGVTGLRNVQLLKWLQEYGIRVDYNILVGFPGETVEDYELQLRIIDAIGHLSPPNGKTTLVRVDRFSPFFDDAEELGIQGVRAAAYYRHLIPPDQARAESYAYFFDHDLEYMAPLRPVIARVDDAIAAWKARDDQRRARLGAGFVEILSYVGGVATRATLRDLDAALFVACDVASSLNTLPRDLGAAPSDVAAAADRLVQAGLMLQVDDGVISLAPFAEPHSDADLASWLEGQGIRRHKPLEVIAS